MFAAVKDSMVAIALGFADQRQVLGKTSTPPSGLFQIVGSGFIVDREQGMVITAGHVLDKLMNERIAADLRKEAQPDWLCVPQQRGIIDRDGDFAARLESWHIKRLRGGGPADVGLVELGASVFGADHHVLALSEEPCMEGDPVVTCSYPLGLELHRNSTVNATFHTGIVSAILPNPNAPQRTRQKLQLDIITLGGSSGGPVVSLESGKVVGVVVQQLFDETPLTPAPKGPKIKVPLGLTFAEDVQVIRQVLEWPSKDNPNDHST
ncbi:MAG: S1 family peptidase [Gemmatimonadaceae bacterium]